MAFRRQIAVLAIALFGAALLLSGLAPQAQGAPGERDSPLSAERSRKLDEDRAKLDRGKKEKQPESRIDEDPEGNPYLAGELIVTYEERTSDPDEDAAKEEIGAQSEEELPAIDAEVVSVPEVKEEPDETTREEVLEDKKQELESASVVEAVDYNYVREKVADPTDPLFDRQWGLQKIQAPQAYDTSTGSDAVVAIVDGGASPGHPDLSGAVVDEWDYYNGDSSANDEDGHGTHVSGIAAARANNNEGIAGVAPDAALLNYDVCGTEYCSDAAITKAIDQAATMGADVINMSLGGPGRSTSQENAVNRAWDKGVVLVAAAGNEYNSGNPTSYPAAYSNVIAVGAATQSDTRASFSNTGSYLDIAAPGYQILSSVPTKQASSGYVSWSGTSMASPFVSGVAALLASQGLSGAEIRESLESTATDLGAAGKDSSFGNGLINAQAALTGEGATSPDPPPPSQEDTVPPEIDSKKPDAETIGTARNIEVTVTFSEEMNKDSLNRLNVELYREGANRPESATVSCDDPCRTVTLDPSTRLGKRTWYLVVIWRDSEGAKDLAGNQLAGEGEYVSWWFKTGRR